jgi:hypothetical protein
MRSVIGIVLLFAFLPIHSIAGEGSPRTSSYSEKDLLKNWALCRCLGKTYVSERDRDDAYKSAAAYLEFSGSPIESFDKLTELIEKYLSRSYTGSVQSNYNTMKCIDLFHSKELDVLTSELANKKNVSP